MDRKTPYGEIEFWMNEWGGIIETEKNPCGCCPNDYLVHWYDRPRSKVSISFKDRQDFMEWVNEKHWEALN